MSRADSAPGGKKGRLAAAFFQGHCLFRNGVLEGLAGLELRGAGSGDGYLLAGAGIAADALGAGLYIEAAEAHEGDLAAGDEFLGDGVKGGGDGLFGVLFADSGLFRNSGYELSLVHWYSSWIF